jgi:hypothetical protein
MKIETGQEFEFIIPAVAEGRQIPKGTRVRVGHILPEVVEPKLTLVTLSGEAPETFTVDRHVVALHCRELKPSG